MASRSAVQEMDVAYKDELLAKQLQSQYDAQVAEVRERSSAVEVSDAALARRLQEEADLEAQFDFATDRLNKELEEKTTVDEIKTKTSLLEVTRRS